MTMQQRLGWQEATPRNSLGQLFPSLGRGDRRGRHKPHANRRWRPETMLLEDRMLLAGSPTPVGFTPAQVATAYGINSIRLHGVIGNGAGQTIAIVDFGNDPTIASDLQAFDQHFGLPAPPSFTVVNQNGQTAPLPPNTNGTNGESGETSMDVEWAHAIAPEASIVLVEGISVTSTMDQVTAIRTAANYPGVSVVSMSFGEPEFAGEQAFDSVFTTPPGHTPVTFLASTGDSSTGINNGAYPAFSPNVLAVGGTTLSLNPNNSYKGEVVWNINNQPGDVDSGGISKYELEPAYQQGFNPTSRRTIPDVSILAGTDATNPGTPIGSVSNTGSGVVTYDSFQNGSATAAANPWYQNGGTSLSVQIWGGLIAIGDQLRQSVGEAPLSTSQALNTLYSLPSSAFHDITVGHNLVPYYAGLGYDLVTGRGSPVANLLVPALAGPVLTSLQREGIHQQTTIDLSFFDALDPGSARDRGNYTLLAEGPHGGFFHQIRLRSARYNAATQTVVLAPERLSLNLTYELLVRGTPPHGLKGAKGIPLVGGNQKVIFSGFTPSRPVT